MPGGVCGLYKNTRGARAEREHDILSSCCIICNNSRGARAAREHDMKRLERAIGIFRKTRKIYKGDTTVYMTMNTDDVAEILGWLEELKEYRATTEKHKGIEMW